MSQARSARIGFCIALISVSLCAISSAADDSARFAGTWKAAIPYNGAWVNFVSVHDAKGFKNYVLIPQGAAPIGDGTFSAADGKWSTSAAAPNDSGTYQFVDKNTVVCLNALGQSLTWQRDNTPLPPIVGAKTAGTSLPAGTNFAQVKVTDAIQVCRPIAKVWQADAVLCYVSVFGPNPDGTVNILANPQAFTLIFGSASAKNFLTLVSAGQTGNFVVKPNGTAPTIDWLPIPDKAIDLTGAYKSVRQFGFTGPISQARLNFGHETNKPERLFWELDAGGSYPWIVSAASGAILSPFEVLDDKVADYNKLAAETAAALHGIPHRAGARGPGGAWMEAGVHFWSADGHEVGGSGASGDEQDTWDNDVAAQNAWENGDSDAEGRFDAGEATSVDVETYGGNEGGE